MPLARHCTGWWLIVLYQKKVPEHVLAASKHQLLCLATGARLLRDSALQLLAVSLMPAHIEQAPQTTVIPRLLPP